MILNTNHTHGAGRFTYPPTVAPVPLGLENGLSSWSCYPPLWSTHIVQRALWECVCVCVVCVCVCMCVCACKRMCILYKCIQHVSLVMLQNPYTCMLISFTYLFSMYVSEFGCAAIAGVAIATPSGDNTDHLYKHWRVYTDIEVALPPPAQVCDRCRNGRVLNQSSAVEKNHYKSYSSPHTSTAYASHSPLHTLTLSTHSLWPHHVHILTLPSHRPF